MQKDWGLLSKALVRLPDDIVERDPVLRIAKEFVGSAFLPGGAMNPAVQLAVDPRRIDLKSLPDPLVDLILSQEMVAHRMRGDLDAVKVARRLRQRLDRPDEQGRRPAHAAVPMHLLHVGITEALAGDCRQAIGDFSKGRMLPHPDGLPVIDWDLDLKRALVSAAIGQHSEADRVLAVAAAEEGPEVGEPFATFIRGTVAAIRALLAVDRLDPDAPELVQEALELNDGAEMWPFALLASTRWMTATGDLVGVLDAIDKAETLEQIPAASLAFEVATVARAKALMLLGELAAAARVLDQVDERPGGLFAIAVARIRLTLLEEGPEPAIAAARRLVVRRGVGPTARVEALLLEAWAQKALLGAVEPTRVAPLGPVIARKGLWRLLQLVPEHVVDDVPGLVGRADFPRQLFLTEPSIGAGLSAVELEVLEALAGPATLAEIAKSRFVSLNTVKTQVASIYRRLGVHGRRAAVSEAMRRGLIARPRG